MKQISQSLKDRVTSVEDVPVPHTGSVGLLVGAPVVHDHAVSLGAHAAIAVRVDKAVITLQFADGSIGVVNNLANGLTMPSGRVLHWRATGASTRVDASTWHPRFGEVLPCQLLSLDFTGVVSFELDFS